MENHALNAPDTSTDSHQSPASERQQLLRVRDVIDRTRLSRTAIYKRIREGSFPDSIKISQRVVAWRESDINRWIADLVSSSATERREDGHA